MSDWKRLDYVVITHGDEGFNFEEHLVAADHPTVPADGSDEPIWVVVAHENDWAEVGQKRWTSYIDEHDAKLVWREGTPEGVTTSMLLENGFKAEAHHLSKEAPWKRQEDKVNAALVAARRVDEQPHKEQPEKVTPRAELLREAEGLVVGDRNKSYGAPTENFSNIADMWNVQFAHLLKDGAKFSPAHVAQAQISTKLSRMIGQPKRDSYVDIAGYAACGWECEDAA